MKKSILTLALLLLAITATAQEEYFKSSTDTVRNRGEHNVGWIRSHILDNWMFDMQGGAHLYMGYEDFKGKFKDHIALDAETHVGRWIFPMVGVRFGLGYANSHGFISKQSYLQNRSQLTKDYGNCQGLSTTTTISGNDTIKGSFGGYFWTTDDENLFRQDWRYFDVSADLMVNLSYMRKYDRVKLGKKWNHILYAGYSIRVGLSENHPEKFSNAIGYSTSDQYKGFKNTNFANEGHIGYIAKYAFNDHLNAHADVRLSILEGDFDRERITRVEKMAPDLDFAVMVGLTYDFNMRNERARRNYYVERGILPYTATDVPKHIAYVQVEDIDVIQVIDTLIVTNYDTINDVVIMRTYDSLVAYYDTTHNKIINPVPDDATLDSILLKRLLPYEMVFFDLDKWDIRAQEEMKIAKMARIMKAYPDRKFILYGSADSKTGTVKRNIFLSHNRADIVKNRLVIEYGIPESQLRCEYLGGILDYDPFILNRTTVIIMDHPVVRREFEKMKAQRKAGGNVIEFND
jgi:hypothetical protein